MGRTYFHTVRCYASYLPNASQPESILPYSAPIDVVRTLHTPCPRTSSISAMGGTQGRVEGTRRGEGPEFRFFLSCQHHCSSNSSWLQPSLPSCTPKPSLLRLLQDTASSWWHSFLQLLSTLNPCSECLGFKWPPMAPLALRQYLLPAVTISQSLLCSFFALSASQHLCS